ncbi:MAG: hypothetical protein J0L71_02730, partial [Candidatus Accumulibacter sp.]|uniref:hypothetical protein n=2 Tax=Accumulibacter sp. TaxID=2053492 RepID=UPI001AC032F1
VGSSGNKAAVGVMSRAQYENDLVIIQDALRWRADLAEYFHRLYDGHNWLGDAASLDTVPFNDEGGERAGAHVRAKNAAMKPQKAALKAIKNGAQSDLPALPGVTQLTELPPMPAVTIEGRRTLPAENKTAPLQTPGMEKEEERLAELARRRKEQIRITDPRRYSILYGD